MVKETKSRQRVGGEPRVRGVLEVGEKMRKKTMLIAASKSTDLRIENWLIKLLLLRLFVTLSKISYCYSNPKSSVA